MINELSKYSEIISENIEKIKTQKESVKESGFFRGLYFFMHGYQQTLGN